MAKIKVDTVDNEYPKMLYKHGGKHEIHGGKFDISTAANADEETALVESGWFLTTPEAAKAFEAEQTELAKSSQGGANVGNWGGAAAGKAKK